MSVSCSICLDAYSSDEGVITLSGCGHVFHMDCLDQWKRTSRLNPPKCPLCQKNYNKRSLTKLYFHLEEVDNSLLDQALKKQKLLSENLQKDKENLVTEIQKKQLELERANSSWTFVYQELNKMKTEYGIKCQAYNIIDTVNTEYLQSNEKLQAENALLKQESDKLRKEIEELKAKNISLMKNNFSNPTSVKQKQIVDLTADDDDEVEIIENEKSNEIIEINDEDDNERKQCEKKDEEIDGKQINECNNNDEIKSAGEYEEDSEDKFLLKELPFQEIDYKTFENFLMSQI